MVGLKMLENIKPCPFNDLSDSLHGRFVNKRFYTGGPEFIGDGRPHNQANTFKEVMGRIIKSTTDITASQYSAIPVRTMTLPFWQGDL